MKAKLTIEVNKKLIPTAKKYAKENGQSLSMLVENYFKLLTNKRRPIRPEELSPRIQRLRGIIKLNNND